MRKDFGPQTWLFPMPVLIVAAYDENGKANAMNAAWGGVYDTNQVVLCLSAGHKTTKNIKAKGAFTVAFATADTLAPSDYVGLASGNDTPDKMERAGFHTVKSAFVDAPVITELPMCLECRLVKVTEEGNIVGEIVNVSAEESVLADDGKPDPMKLQPIIFDATHAGYHVLGQRIGAAFAAGKKLM